jgi:hypothetical protein
MGRFDSSWWWWWWWRGHLVGWRPTDCRTATTATAAHLCGMCGACAFSAASCVWSNHGGPALRRGARTRGQAVRCCTRRQVRCIRFAVGRSWHARGCNGIAGRF